MSLPVFYYCLCACLRRCHSFNLSLCHLSPFHLSYAAVSRPCRLSEFTLTGPHYMSNIISREKVNSSQTDPIAPWSG